MNEKRIVAATDALLSRVRGEYLEMPGLRLTEQQAQRLWGLDCDACRQVLEALTATRFLCRAPDGSYARANDDLFLKVRRSA
jgi:hypothetical protein